MDRSFSLFQYPPTRLAEKGKHFILIQNKQEFEQEYLDIFMPFKQQWNSSVLKSLKKQVDCNQHISLLIVPIRGNPTVE